MQYIVSWSINMQLSNRDGHSNFTPRGGGGGGGVACSKVTVPFHFFHSYYFNLLMKVVHFPSACIKMYVILSLDIDVNLYSILSTNRSLVKNHRQVKSDYQKRKTRFRTSLRKGV